MQQRQAASAQSCATSCTPTRATSADGAAWPIKNGVTKFRGELEAYIRAHQSPAYQVTPLQEAIAHGVRPDPTALVSLSAPAPPPAGALHAPGGSL